MWERQLIMMPPYSIKIFADKTFANCPKPQNSQKVFTRERFPLYGIFSVGYVYSTTLNWDQGTHPTSGGLAISSLCTVVGMLGVGVGMGEGEGGWCERGWWTGPHLVGDWTQDRPPDGVEKQSALTTKLTKSTDANVGASNIMYCNSGNFNNSQLKETAKIKNLKT